MLPAHAFSYRKQFDIVNNDKKIIENQRVSKGHDEWIGRDSIIMPWVSIGDGAVIGAGAVVTKNVKTYEIVAGVPVKNLRFRFEQNIIDELEKIQLWNFSDEILKK